MVLVLLAFSYRSFLRFSPVSASCHPREAILEVERKKKYAGSMAKHPISCAWLLLFKVSGLNSMLAYFMYLIQTAPEALGGGLEIYNVPAHPAGPAM